MEEKIKNLYAKGKSYRQIEKILGCSRSLISYYCGDGQKEKNITRQRKNRYKNCLSRKLGDFKRPSYNRRKKIKNKKSKTYYKDVVDKIGDEPTCYLTGRTIDVLQPKTYCFDHVVPSSKGGDNEITNLGIACKEANTAKSDLSVNELLQLCEDILQHHGYVIQKPIN